MLTTLKIKFMSFFVLSSKLMAQKAPLSQGRGSGATDRHPACQARNGPCWGTGRSGRHRHRQGLSQASCSDGPAKTCPLKCVPTWRMQRLRTLPERPQGQHEHPSCRKILVWCWCAGLFAGKQGARGEGSRETGMEESDIVVSKGEVLLSLDWAAGR